MKMSEEMAVRLHRMMWSDMQKELGDNPGAEERFEYKKRWVKKHFPGAVVQSNCFLCEFMHTPHSGANQCTDCPIRWPNSSCTTEAMHYQSAPISKILSLPARNEKLTGFEAKYIAYDRAAAAEMYYEYRESLLSKASGIPASSAIGDHVKAIQEKAVEEYFANTPGAKLATMDVDEAFKQYADEQKAPIFKQLSKASELSEIDYAIADHIESIKNKSKQEGRDEANEHMKYLLAKQSGLDRNRPVDDHIREIVKNSMEAGAAEERDRIQEKIYEVLLS